MRWVKEAEAEDAFHGGQAQGNRDHRGPQDHDYGRGVMRPDKKRQAEPSHARRSHSVHGNQEVEPGKNRGETGDEYADHGGSHCGVRIDGAQRGVERPTGIEAARDHGVQRKGAADNVDVPAEKIDFRESQILRPNHQWDQEIAKHRGDRRNQEEENHGDAMHGEHAVVGVGGEESAVRRHQVQANHHGEEAADEEKESDRGEIE